MRLAPSEGKNRISGRENDRMELEKLDFHERVYEGYKLLEKDNPDRIIGIDASGTIEAIHDVIIKRMEELL